MTAAIPVKSGLLPKPLDPQYLLELPEFVTQTELHSASSLAQPAMRPD